MLCLQIQPSIVESEAWWNKCIVVYSWSRWTYFKTVHSQYNKVTMNTTVCLPVLSEILSKTHTVEFILFSSSFVEYHFLTDFIVVMINKIKCSSNSNLQKHKLNWNHCCPQIYISLKLWFLFNLWKLMHTNIDVFSLNFTTHIQ